MELVTYAYGGFLARKYPIAPFFFYKSRNWIQSIEISVKTQKLLSYWMHANLKPNTVFSSNAIDYVFKGP